MAVTSAPLKLYMHYEGDATGFTHIAKCVDATRTIQQLKEEFVLAYNKKHPGRAALHISGINVTNDRQRVLPSSGLVVKLLNDKEDVFVVRDARAEAALSNQVKPLATMGGGLKPKLPSDTQAMINKLLSFASEAQAQRNYLNATKILENVLLLDATNRDALRSLAVMAAASGKHALAVDRFRTAIKAHPDSAFLHKSLGDSLLALKEYQDALLAYDTALGLVDLEEEAEHEREAQRKVKRGEAVPPSPEAGASSKDIKLASVMALHEMGQSGLAGQILMPMLEADKSDPGTLLAYATILLARGKAREALGVFLHLLVARPSDRVVRAQLTEAVRAPGGIAALYEEISGGSAPALAFIANVIKDHGAVEQAAELFQRAVQLEPGSASYLLNYVHALESCNRQDDAIMATLDYCRRAADVTLASGLFRLGDTAPIVERVLVARVASAPFHLRYFAAEAGGPVFGADGAVAGGSRDGMSIEDKVSSSSSSSSNEDNAPPSAARAGEPSPEVGTAVAAAETSPVANMAALTVGMARSSGAVAADAVASGSSGANGSTGLVSVEYPDTDLDVLALVATLVKLLFFNGAVSGARQVAALLEPARAASAKPLHTTLIRNEVAYFSCIHQLLTEHPLPPPHVTPPGPAPLFIAGDSHSTSPGWRSVRLRGEARRLVPVIVTGLKVWHLREESRFYPKVGFENAMRALPDGSQVVMLFGEIDCREGLLVAVERSIYATVEEGMRVTIGIYLRVLARLIAERGFEIWVHPVLPVLKETAHIVAPYNALLKEMVTGAMATQPRLHWLEFVGELVTADGMLREELKLDGTHINPAYLTHVQSGVDKAS